MARQISYAIALAAASATAVCASHTPLAGAATLDGGAVTGGVAVLDTARRILVTTAANESTNVVSLTGTDRRGNRIFETMTGPNAGAAYTFQDFATVTAVSWKNNAAGAVTIGTNGIASTEWCPMSTNADSFNVGYSVTFGSASASILVEGTQDEINRSVFDCQPGNESGTATTPQFSKWTPPVALPLSATLTANATGVLTMPTRAIRMTVLSGATTAGLKMTVQPAGVWG